MELYACTHSIIITIVDLNNKLLLADDASASVAARKHF